MEKAIETCDLIEAICDTNQHIAFYPLATAAHSFYGRPFKRSNGVGRLNADMIPPESNGIHQWLIHFRDGAYAHLDANHDDIAGRPMHDVVYSHGPDGNLLTTCDARAPLSAYKDARNHAKIIQAIFMDEIFYFHNRFLDMIPTTEGDFLLSLDSATDLFIPYSMQSHSVIHYK